MSLTPPPSSPTSALKWKHNQTPNLTKLINSKAAWYTQFNDNFWTNWEENVFDLRTASPFGLLIWCIILGVPSQIFGLYANPKAWAFGNKRQNFDWSAGGVPPSYANVMGGNFIGGNSTQLLDINEARMALRMRYYSLISNGRPEMINAALLDVFGINSTLPVVTTVNKWDFANKKYLFLADSTMPSTQPVLPSGTGFTVPAAGTMTYHLGANYPMSTQLFSVMNNPAYGIMPTVSGIRYTVHRDS
jgi:hypothetical protein